MKIVVTVTDVASVVYAGGSPESKSGVMELGDDLPKVLLDYLRDRKHCKENPRYECYKTVSFSILEEV